ncbi:MAG: patatin family protein [Raoultibacter sp.]
MSTTTHERTHTLRSDHQAAYLGHEVLPVNLVLEGGAMRGQFTAGVLDFFMDYGLVAQHTIGTSAGALNGYNYVAGEDGRTCYLNTKYCNDWRYLSMKSFVKTGNAFGRDFSFNELPNKLEPYDFDAFRNSPMKLTTVASDLVLGEADYHTFVDPVADLPYLMASSSLPLLSKTIEVDGKYLLDGGTCDSVPLLYSLMTGASKHIVVLTQDATYKKGPEKLLALQRQRYSDYPYYIERLANRHFEYNRTYRAIARMENSGMIFVVRPPAPLTISNMERDPEKLFALYEEGYTEAAKSWPALQAYLEL